MINYKTIFLFVLGLFGGCNSNQTVTILEEFSESTNLNSSYKYDLTLDFVPNDIEVFDSLVVLSKSSGSQSLVLYNLRTGNRSSWLDKGRSRVEIGNLNGIYKYNDSLLYVDAAPGKIFLYNVNNVSKGDFTPTRIINHKHTMFNTSALTPDDILIFQGKQSPEIKANKRFCRLDLSQDVLREFGDFSENDEIIQSIPDSDYSRHTAYQGDIIYNKEKSVCVTYSFYGVGFDIICIEKGDIIKSKYWQYPQVEVKNAMGANIVVNNPSSKKGFLDACFAGESVYFLYSDKTFEYRGGTGKYILKFNLKGEAEHLYVLDREAEALAITKDETVLYIANEESIFSYQL